MLARLTALDRVTTDRGLDALVLLEKEPDLLHQWLCFQDELLNRSADLGFDTSSFHRKTSGNASSPTDVGGSAELPVVKVDWFELCFALAVQLRTQRSDTEGKVFPRPLPRKVLEMWPRKKVAFIAEEFERIADESVYNGQLDLMRKSAVRWCFTIDTFLSELEEVRLRVWRTRCKAEKLAGDTDPRELSISRDALLELAGLSCAEMSDADLINAVELAIERLQSSFRVEDLGAPTSEAAIDASIRLDSESRKQLEQLDELLRGDYRTRRELSIERLDVTLQSFMWSKRGAEAEQQMMEETQAMRSGLSSEPSHASLDSILATHLDHFQALNGRRLEEGAHLRSLVIGPVPDRGGRTEELGEREMQQAKRGQWRATTSHWKEAAKSHRPEATREEGAVNTKIPKSKKKKKGKSGSQQASAATTSHP